MITKQSPCGFKGIQCFSSPSSFFFSPWHSGFGRLPLLGAVTGRSVYGQLKTGGRKIGAVCSHIQEINRRGVGN